MTSDQLEFAAISGPIPNRGFLQSDINMFGLTYLQQISDANLKAGLHIEPGLWAAVPKTSDPNVSATVVRLAAIPHGTAAAVFVRPPRLCRAFPRLSLMIAVVAGERPAR